MRATKHSKCDDNVLGKVPRVTGRKEFLNNKKRMTTRVRPQVKSAIDQAIQQGAQPTAPRAGVGLVLRTPTGRYRTLVDKKGLTSAGKYYYQKTGLPNPGIFDYNQDAVRKGRSQFIKIMDGSTKKVSTWDPNAREWKHTALGKQFFSKSVDRYTILWPVSIQLTRKNGSIYERIDWLPSTATSLGEIEVPRALTEQAQRAKVASIEAAWRANQEMIGDRRALVVGYESATLDTSRQIQYNKLSMGSSGFAEAVMHRNLREGKPWAFHGMEGVSEDAYEQTEGRCVSYQLSKHLKFKGGVAPWSQEKIAEMLWNITEEIYEGDEDNPPEQGIGYSAAAITQLCKDLQIPVHIKWNGTKIEVISAGAQSI